MKLSKYSKIIQQVQINEGDIDCDRIIISEDEFILVDENTNKVFKVNNFKNDVIDKIK